MTYDAALLGGGGAALAVLHHLCAQLRTGDRPGPAVRRPLRVVVVDPVDRLEVRPADRTWCSWDVPGAPSWQLVEPAVHRSWREVLLVGADGREHRLDLAPLRYRMVRGEDWYALVADAVAEATAAGQLVVEHVGARAGAVTAQEGGVLAVDLVRERPDTGAAAGAAAVEGVRARLVLDSRPTPPRRPARSALAQRFAGQRLRAPVAAFDPERAVLMDFSVPQPERGLSFGYVLPSSPTLALVEHTSFVPAAGADTGEDAAGLARYADGLARAAGAPDGWAVEHEEVGDIPMTDAAAQRRRGPGWWAVGTSGGAVRPATGYAFATMQRQARAVAAALVAGRGVAVPRPHARRHAWMDALVLRGLLDGSLDGPAFFERLLTGGPPARVLRVLDGLSGPAEELAVMATAPTGAMLSLAARDALGRLSRPPSHR